MTDRHPQEYNLSRQREAFGAIESEWQARAITRHEAWREMGICLNSFYAWRSGSRSPALRNMVKIADAFGFQVIMRRGATEYDLADQVAAMVALNAERRAIAMSLADMEERSGVSANTFYAWLSGSRSPALFNLVAISQTFGFEVIMRGKPNAPGV